MHTEFFISWRYLFTKRKEKFISLISIISVSGVAIGVAALIVVIAVMSGFNRDLRDKIVGNYSHITVAGFEGINGKDYPGLVKKIESNPEVTGVSGYLAGQVLVKEGKRYFAAGLKGINPETEVRVSKIKEYLLAGSLSELKGESVIIGKELAFYTGSTLGSTLTVYSPLGKLYNLKVAGIFSSGMYDYDMNLIFTDLSAARQILGLEDKFSALAVKINNIFDAEKVRNELYPLLGAQYNIKTWVETNQNFFAALKLEKITMFIILTLVILVASFNIISTLIVMVVEKTKDIGILKSIGMTNLQIRKIFTYEGLIIGLSGITTGGLSGILLCLLLKKYQFIKIPQDIYYIDRLPVALNWTDILLIIFAAFLITLFSTVYPASKAARFKPVEALRYE